MEPTDLLGFAGSGVLGSLFGGLFRLAPEVLKFFDRKNERSHELSMFKLQTDLEKVKGDYKMEEKYTDFSIAQMNAIQAANETDAKIASNSYKWVSALIGSVRPGITLILFMFYIIVKITFIANGFAMDMQWAEIVRQTWTQDDFMMLMMVLTYWFLGRDIAKYHSKS